MAEHKLSEIIVDHSLLLKAEAYDSIILDTDVCEDKIIMRGWLPFNMSVHSYMAGLYGELMGYAEKIQCSTLRITATIPDNGMAQYYDTLLFKPL